MTFMEDFDRALRLVDLSTTSTAKWRHVKDLVADNLSIEPEDIYCSYINRASNAQVRIGKQMRGDRTYIVAFAFAGDGNRTSSSYDKWPRFAVEQGLTDAVLLWFETGEVGTGRWRPERAYYRIGWPHLDTIRSWNADLEAHLVAGGGGAPR